MIVMLTINTEWNSNPYYYWGNENKHCLLLKMVKMWYFNYYLKSSEVKFNWHNALNELRV